jgi:nitrogenase iron protein
MERIAFYGKGGIGKSTIAAGVSWALAKQGKKVLHVGCDPKHDSTAVLLAGQDGFKTVIGQVFSQPVDQMRREHVIMKGKLDIDCVESGGPEPGVGCGGRAVSRMFELFGEFGLLDDPQYDAIIFDVLGDVVCGGFAAPLRSGIAPKVVVVASEEMMAGYAANNICRAVLHYLDNGVCLAGMVLNQRDNHADFGPVERLAGALGIKILARIPRDPGIQKAELARQSILESRPKSPAAVAIRKLAGDLMRIRRDRCRAPRPLDTEALRVVMAGG